MSYLPSFQKLEKRLDGLSVDSASFSKEARVYAEFFNGLINRLAEPPAVDRNYVRSYIIELSGKHKLPISQVFLVLGNLLQGRSPSPVGVFYIERHIEQHINETIERLKSASRELDKAADPFVSYSNQLNAYRARVESGQVRSYVTRQE